MHEETLIIQKLNDIEDILRLNSDIVFNFNQACKYLDLSPSYLYKLTSAKQIPHYKPKGKRLYFIKAELNAWIKNQSTKPF
jgi:excisionase family DNA binding protein